MKRLLLVFIPALAAWDIPSPPPGFAYGPITPPPAQCDYEPTRPYVVLRGTARGCGNAYACSFPHAKPCRIFIRDLPPDLYADHLRHEKGHCNCPDWID